LQLWLAITAAPFSISSLLVPFQETL
jgi:hypothetical protein